MKVSNKQLLLYFLAASVLFGVPFFINSSPVSGHYPQIFQTTLSGKKANQLPNPRLIYFWAEWCGICKMMQSPISAVLKDYPGITIAVKSGDDNFVNSYLSKQGLNWPTINDAQGDIVHQYGVQGVPAVFILNREGQVAFATSGYSSELGLRFRLWLAAL